MKKNVHVKVGYCAGKLPRICPPAASVWLKEPSVAAGRLCLRLKVQHRNPPSAAGQSGEEKKEYCLSCPVLSCCGVAVHIPDAVLVVHHLATARRDVLL